jgi:hypothetical protein
MKLRFESRSNAPSPIEVPMNAPRRVLTPKSLFHGLARELDLLAPAYGSLRCGHPALSPFLTLPRLLEYITTGPHGDAKTALLAELVAIRQSSPHRLWVAILLRAFRPMLRTLWKKLFGSDGQERLALLILAFQEALREVNPTRDPVRIAMYVRQATRRRVIASLVKEVAWGEDGFGEEADGVPDEREPDSPGERRTAMRRLLERGVLAAHVRRHCPTMPAEDQAQLCQTLRRGLQRVCRASDVAAKSEVTL